MLKANIQKQSFLAQKIVYGKLLKEGGILKVDIKNNAL